MTFPRPRTQTLTFCYIQGSVHLGYTRRVSPSRFMTPEPGPCLHRHHIRWSAERAAGSSPELRAVCIHGPRLTNTGRTCEALAAWVRTSGNTWALGELWPLESVL